MVPCHQLFVQMFICKRRSERRGGLYKNTSWVRYGLRALTGATVPSTYDLAMETYMMEDGHRWDTGPWELHQLLTSSTLAVTPPFCLPHERNNLHYNEHSVR